MRRPIVALAGLAALALSACTTDGASEPSGPTVEQAVEASNDLHALYGPFIAEPRVNFGTYTYDLTDNGDVRTPTRIHLRCLSDGPISITVNGTEEANMEDCQSGSMEVGFGEAPGDLEVIINADGDFFWVAAVE